MLYGSLNDAKTFMHKQYNFLLNLSITIISKKHSENRGNDVHLLMQERPNENPATSSLETLVDALLQVP